MFFPLLFLLYNIDFISYHISFLPSLCIIIFCWIVLFPLLRLQGIPGFPFFFAFFLKKILFKIFSRRRREKRRFNQAQWFFSFVDKLAWVEFRIVYYLILHVLLYSWRRRREEEDTSSKRKRKWRILWRRRNDNAVVSLSSRKRVTFADKKFTTFLLSFYKNIIYLQRRREREGDSKEERGKVGI